MTFRRVKGDSALFHDFLDVVIYDYGSKIALEDVWGEPIWLGSVAQVRELAQVLLDAADYITPKKDPIP